MYIYGGWAIVKERRDLQELNTKTFIMEATLSRRAYEEGRFYNGSY